jgi:hypothetical protein
MSDAPGPVDIGETDATAGPGDRFRRLAEYVTYTGEPQVGQKERVFTLPLSATMFRCVALPWNSTPTRANVR